MKKLALAVVLVGSIFMSGCTFPRPQLVNALLIGDSISPEPSFVNNGVSPRKKGEASQKGVLFFVSGDASIQAAMQNGGITKVHHIDYKVNSILGLVTQTTTIVYGE